VLHQTATSTGTTYSSRRRFTARSPGIGYDWGHILIVAPNQNPASGAAKRKSRPKD
jgi:hypothetical protein